MSDVTCNLDFNSSTDIAICNENMEASVPLKEYSNFDLNSKDLNDLPTLVIEIILSHFTYYQILQLRLISPYWDFVVIEYLNKANRSFVNNLSKYRVQWVSVKEQIEDFNQFPESGEFSQRKKTRSIPKMSPRYYHSACYTNNYMYVFGGCISPSTAYNDLWRFNVTTKKWHRIIAEGSLPLPRLFSSFTHYEFKDDNDVVQHYIVLFGGLLFDEKLDIKDRLLSSIHFFDISKNRWSLIQIQNDMHLKSCQHSAVVIENELIILNGFRMIKNEEIDRSKVFVFDLKKHFWRLQNMKFNKTNMDPPLRQTLVKRKVIPSPFVLDKHNILSMCDNTMSLNKKLTLHPMMYIAPYILKRSHCNDVLCEQCKSKREQLSEDATWEMTQVDISKTDVDMELIFSGEFCKVGNFLAYFTVKHILKVSPFTIQQLVASAPLNRREPSLHNNKRLLHERRIETLEYYRKHFHSRISNSNASIGWGNQKVTLQLRLLDTSRVFTENKIYQIRQFQDFDYTVSPEALFSYSLVATPESIILFGGYAIDQMKETQNVSNKVYMLVSKPVVKPY